MSRARLRCAGDVHRPLPRAVDRKRAAGQERHSDRILVLFDRRRSLTVRLRVLSSRSSFYWELYTKLDKSLATVLDF